MLSSNLTSILLFLLSAIIHCVHSLDYSDLQALGVACPNHRDRCTGYTNNMTYVDRSCECDAACNSYKDCCIDASRRPNRRNSLANLMTCIPYGAGPFQGVYVINSCCSTWRGSLEVRQKCEGPQNFSDPLTAAPVTSVVQRVTYRNRFCAECNHANLRTLKTFQVNLACDGLSLNQDQMYAYLTYNRTTDTWGVNRMNSFGNASNFIGCKIIFDIPEYLNNSVRFCRSSVISRCHPDWSRQQVQQHCEDYMAVVYDYDIAYRNAHCAICNNIPVGQLSCGTNLNGRRRPMQFALMLDINQSDGDKVGVRGSNTPECPAKHIYDPFIKSCRKLVCALPNHVVRAGKCVRG